MAKSQKFIYQETWETRYGKSPRTVVRERGRFVQNKSKNQIRKGESLDYTKA